MKRRLWSLCLSKIAKQQKARVRILSENHRSKKGEQIQVLGTFNSYLRAQNTRLNFGDKLLANQWCTYFYVDEKNAELDPHGYGRY